MIKGPFDTEDMDTSGLDAFEIKEIKKGNYDIFHFEEEDLEDDDYYFEDEE